MRKTLIFVLLISTSSVLGQTNDPFPVCDKGRCGYMNTAGKIVVPLQFDEASDFSDGLARVLVGDKYGFVDQTGRMVIAPRFAVARDFTEGLAAVTESDDPMVGEWGYVDKSGTVVIPYQFKSALSFSEGLAPVEVQRTEGLVHERTGTRLLSLWGYVNKNGEMVIPPKLIAAFPFTDGVARLWTGAFVSQNKYGLIDKTGKEIIEPKFDNIVSDFHEGLAPFRIGNKWGFIDTSGKVVIEPRFDVARGFSEGFGRIALKNRSNVAEWGYIDRTGKVVIEPQFEAVGDFSEGLAWVRPFSSGHGYIDTSGKMIIKPKFATAENFRNGIARVTVTGSQTIVDPHGTESKALKYGYVNRTGKYVWKPSY